MDARRALESHGIRPTSQRVAIADYLLVTDEHPSADQVWERVRERAEEIARRLVGFDPVALRKSKEAMLRSRGVPRREAYDIQQACWQDLLREQRARRVKG